MRRNLPAFGGGSERFRGLALIAVLWIVAAMSLIVTGIVRSTRMQISAGGVERLIIQADAIGAAAVNITLQKMLLDSVPPNRLLTVPVDFEGVRVLVEVVPANGLINLNTAPLNLLIKLFQFAGGMSQDAASALSQRLVEARDLKDSSGVAVGFDAPEDLLQFPGVDYGLYARLKGLITADRGGAGRVNAAGAPLGVLSVLAGGDAALAMRIDRARSVQGASFDSTGLPADNLDETATNRFVLIAHVPLADGRYLLSRRRVYLLPGAGSSLLPWRILGADRQIDSPPS